MEKRVPTEAEVAGYLADRRNWGRWGKDDSAGTVNLRSDVWSWLAARSRLTGESTEHIAERAISLYRLRLEGGPQGVPSVPVSAIEPQ